MANRGLIAKAILVFLAISVQSGAALKCWTCNSLFTDTCADPFDPSQHVISDCDIPPLNIGQLDITSQPRCMKLITTAAGQRIISRSCAFENNLIPDLCKSGIENTLEFCETCTTDGCNSGSYLLPVLMMILLPVLTMIRN